MEDLEREIMLDLVRVTETAALRAAPWMGKGDKKSADGDAVDGMRGLLDLVHFRGTVVIGEGEKDKAPMLYIGEKVGRNSHGPELDIAVDPLEGTSLVAKGLPNALAVLAAAGKDRISAPPSYYLEKIAVGPEVAGHVDINAPPRENIKVAAAVLGKRVQDITVCILDRPRHAALIEEVREAGARIKLISDGDVAGAIATALPDSGVDLLMGVGGSPEGVLAAAALTCLGGELQGRMWFRTPEDQDRLSAAYEGDVHRTFTQHDLIRGESILFAVTGVTDGDLVKGVRYDGRLARTESLLMRARTRTIRRIQTIHQLDVKTVRSRAKAQEIQL